MSPLRVIAGEAGGRTLRGATLKDVRPTSNRMREALFASLGSRVLKARVLDLFAGSGALGIEALSRGAERAVFVEKAQKAAATIARNLEDTDLAKRGSVRKMPVESYLRRPSLEGPFDIVLIDPPYDSGLPSQVLSALRANGFLSGHAIVVLEVSARLEATDEIEGYEIDAYRRYGDSALIYMSQK